LAEKWVNYVGVLTVSENAVRIQIAVARSAFLLLRLAQAAQKAVQSPFVFAGLVRANLMHRRRIDRLLHSQPDQKLELNQRTLQWATKPELDRRGGRSGMTGCSVSGIAA